MEYAALAILAFVAAIVLYGLYLRRRPHGGELPKETPQPVSPLANLVWSAHVASEKHDLAILTGTPAELETTMQELITASDRLYDYLNYQTRLKEKSDD